MTRTKHVAAFTATSTTVTQQVTENGLCRMLIIDVPNFTNAVTTAVSVLDANDYVLWTKTGIAKNTVTRIDETTTPILGSIPFDYSHKIKVELSGAAGGTGGDVKVMAYVDTGAK